MIVYDYVRVSTCHRYSCPYFNASNSCVVVSCDVFVFMQRNDWPFTVFCEELFKDLFDPVWEVKL